ncbi:MAG: hypothetical protein U0796_08710 [Gemmatales bacterium]
MPTVNRGKLLLYVAVVLLVLERLIITGLALSQSSKPINWTFVLLPLTHIAVVLFLLFTSDLLIYWLVILWGVITSGTYFYKIYLMYLALTAAEQAVFFTKVLPAWWQMTALALFHAIITILILFPSVRSYLAQQRSKLDFVDMPPTSQPQNTDDIP